MNRYSDPRSHALLNENPSAGGGLLPYGLLAKETPEITKTTCAIAIMIAIGYPPKGLRPVAKDATFSGPRI